MSYISIDTKTQLCTTQTPAKRFQTSQHQYTHTECMEKTQMNKERTHFHLIFSRLGFVQLMNQNQTGQSSFYCCCRKLCGELLWPTRSNQAETQWMTTPPCFCFSPGDISPQPHASPTVSVLLLLPFYVAQGLSNAPSTPLSPSDLAVAPLVSTVTKRARSPPIPTPFCCYSLLALTNFFPPQNRNRQPNQK
ncbi:hypothetical protein BaRGS_00023403 [Batillaria attramentaria]|uniref:Uncharacterized protein n=1 Tax=Batillaria attramentaria TaxID=370345 RepID=A0ABD0KDV9_9CAEN